MDIRKQLKTLEEKAAILDPDEAGRKVLFTRVNALAEEFLNNLEELPMYESAGEEGAELSQFPVTEDGEDPDAVMDLFKSTVLDPDALEAAVRADRDAGLVPWLLVGSGGTTDTGSVDPLDPLADIAKEYGLWFHVDGAYGAAFALCRPGREMLSGMEKSDSLVVDPHKGFFLPFGTGVVLVREGVNLHRSFHYQAHYMQDQKTLARLEQMSPAELSPELSRHFRGLRLWLPLKLAGIGAFRAALEEKILLANYFWEQLQEIPGIETGPRPDLSIHVVHENQQ